MALNRKKRQEMADFPRLIEFAFPLKQTSLDSVHEKNVRHGHISTLHIWPARRPLAACRAALIATLLPDPGDAEKRKELCEKIAGKVVKKIEKKKMPNGQIVERIKEETEGGILHWGRETENAETLEWFRQEIRKAYGGRAPKVLDPFAGGGAIPLEAMRLGCEATAVDINPVAWFVLKCTLEYPQTFAGQTRPLPEFILQNDAFMGEFFKKAKGYGKAEVKAAIKRLHEHLKKKPKRSKNADQASFQFQQDGDGEGSELMADLAWHVRACGENVLDRARRELAQYYPTYADFEPIKKDHIPYEHLPMRLVPLKDDGTANIEALNSEFTEDYVSDPRNPRWVMKPTIAYLWVRTVTCKHCRAMVPLLKTKWLCKKASKRVLLSVTPNSESTNVVFGVCEAAPAAGGNAAQRREHDKRIGAGTMSRAGARCVCCSTISTSEDIRLEGQAGRLGQYMMVSVVDTPDGKQYRLATDHERALVDQAAVSSANAFAEVPFGIPNEPIPQGGSRSGGGSPFTVVMYGLSQWSNLFTPRQLVAIASFVRAIRMQRDALAGDHVNGRWVEACQSYLALIVGKLLDYGNSLCSWYTQNQQITHLFNRFALPMKWDFAETSPIGGASGSWDSMLGSLSRSLETAVALPADMPQPRVIKQSAIQLSEQSVDVILTDPPYYDAIPYSDVMDFFYVWHRRLLSDLSPDFDKAMDKANGPKWDHELRDGELIDDASRHGGSLAASKQSYEDGMFRVFVRCWTALTDSGRLVVVFANKQPDAWETLVSAIIRAGFTVDGSWPIQTEMSNRTRSHASAALASSVWLVCKKRNADARPGWDNNVLQEMRANIAAKLREFWDAGIRGPDFVWAATGPAMEAYSKHPVVRKANAPGEVMDVGEFLNHVRRMVVDYIVGQVLSGEQGADMAAADRLDEVSAYYLLHRHDFGLEEAPVGACILYATACGLLDTELEKTWDILTHAGSNASLLEYDDGESEEADDAEGDDEPAEETGGGSKVNLKAWNQRRNKSLGYEAPEGKAVPLIDRIHRVMHLWKDGDVQKVDEFLDQHALRRNELFRRVVQSLIELSTNSERSLLESISNHIGAKGAIRDRGPTLPFGEDE